MHIKAKNRIAEAEKNPDTRVSLLEEIPKTASFDKLIFTIKHLCEEGMTKYPDKAHILARIIARIKIENESV
jgi:hypothetical protein